MSVHAAAASRSAASTIEYPTAVVGAVPTPSADTTVDCPSGEPMSINAGPDHLRPGHPRLRLRLALVVRLLRLICRAGLSVKGEGVNRGGIPAARGRSAQAQ